ncbi:unnamed protein product [Prunus armeniaca]
MCAMPSALCHHSVHAMSLAPRLFDACDAFGSPSSVYACNAFGTPSLNSKRLPFNNFKRISNDNSLEQQLQDITTLLIIHGLSFGTLSDNGSRHPRVYFQK